MQSNAVEVIFLCVLVDGRIARGNKIRSDEGVFVGGDASDRRGDDATEAVIDSARILSVRDVQEERRDSFRD